MSEEECMKAPICIQPVTTQNFFKYPLQVLLCLSLSRPKEDLFLEEKTICFQPVYLGGYTLDCLKKHS